MSDSKLYLDIHILFCSQEHVKKTFLKKKVIGQYI